MKTKNITRRGAIIGAAGLGLTACAPKSKITRRYNGPIATGVLVEKTSRKMYILNGNTPLSIHDIDLGFAPAGPKRQEGDGRTPEGQYFIDRRNYNSSFFLSLGISYPNAQDRARAAAAGVNPGGDIFIHGAARHPNDMGRPDWTAGCIAVTDAEMQMIYQMVPVGVPIWINA
jgi:murein L,D-transpeptidase YafK